MDQPDRNADQNNNNPADEKLGHGLGKFNWVEGVALGFLNGEARADGEDTAGDTDASDDEEGNEIGNTDIVGGRDEQAGDGAQNFHDDENEKNLIDDRDEAGEKWLMQEHGIEDVINEVDRNRSSDDEKKNSDVAVGDNFAFGNQAEKSGAKAGRVGFQAGYL